MGRTLTDLEPLDDDLLVRLIDVVLLPALRGVP